MGIRTALGAGRREVLGLIVGHGLGLAGAGVVLGLSASLVFTRLLRGLLVGVAETDALTFVTVAVALALVALAACTTPALRAARLEPLSALRER